MRSIDTEINIIIIINRIVISYVRPQSCSKWIEDPIQRHSTFMRILCTLHFSIEYILCNGKSLRFSHRWHMKNEMQICGMHPPLSISSCIVVCCISPSGSNARLYRFEPLISLVDLIWRSFRATAAQSGRISHEALCECYGNVFSGGRGLGWKLTNNDDSIP